MKLAAVGDIHSNYIALERFLEWAESSDIDGIVFLGDYVTDMPYPQKTVELLRKAAEKYRTWFIRGNREDYLLNYRKNPTGWRYGSRQGALLYTYESLDSASLQWFSEMPQSLDIETPSGAIHAVHTPPYHFPRQKLPAKELLQATAAEMEYSVLLCAHSHVPLVYKENGKLIVNCGPLGIPNGETGAFFAVLNDDNGWNAEIIHLDYDIEALCNGFHTSGLYDKAGFWALGTIETLRTGKEYAVDCGDEVNRMLRENPSLTETEELWKIAAKNIGLI